MAAAAASGAQYAVGLYNDAGSLSISDVAIYAANGSRNTWSTEAATRHPDRRAPLAAGKARRRRKTRQRNLPPSRPPTSPGSHPRPSGVPAPPVSLSRSLAWDGTMAVGRQ